MRIFLKIVTAALLLAVTSCGAFRNYSRSMSEIRTGMTQKQVRDLMGRPDMRSFEGSAEQWQYYYDVDSGSAYILMSVNFDDGQVVSMESRRIDKPGIRHRDARPASGVHVGVELHSDGD